MDVVEATSVIFDSENHGVIDVIGPGMFVVSPTRRIDPIMPGENCVLVPVTAVVERAIVPARQDAS
jgi:hypothetical protein